MIEILRRNIKIILDNYKIKPTYVERKAGLTRGVLVMFLNKKSNYPKFETIFLIARYLKCSLDELAGLNFQKKNYFLDKTPWNILVFEKILEYTNEYIKKEKINISGQRALDIMKEIYILYYKENTDLSSEIDTVFIRYAINNINFN